MRVLSDRQYSDEARYLESRDDENASILCQWKCRDLLLVKLLQYLINKRLVVLLIVIMASLGGHRR